MVQPLTDPIQQPFPQTSMLVSPLPTAYISDITVLSCFLVGDHYEFSILITGRSRFLHSNTSSHVSYKHDARYNDLLNLHKALEKELAAYVQALGRKMPTFPGKSWFGCPKSIAEKRVILLNQYFDELFRYYSVPLSHSPSLLDFFEPHTLQLFFLGATKERQIKFLQALILALARDAEGSPKGKGSIGSSSAVSCVSTLSTVSEGETFNWQHYLPIDFLHADRLYRIDLPDIYWQEFQFESADAVFNLCQLANCVCFVGIDLEKKQSLSQAKEIIGSFKLFETEGSFKVPAFAALGFSGSAKAEVSKGEVLDYMKELYGEEGISKYSEVGSGESGSLLIEALGKLIASHMKQSKIAKSHK